MAVTLDATRVPCPHAFNAVALRGCNEDEIPDLVRWSHGRAFDLTLIETVPTGEIDADRRDQYLPLPRARKARAAPTLHDIPCKSGGPARYGHLGETGGGHGFITPLTHNFCEACNRVRVTAPAHSICVYRAGVRCGALGALWCFGGTAKRSMRAISIPT